MYLETFLNYMSTVPLLLMKKLCYGRKLKLSIFAHAWGRNSRLALYDNGEIVIGNHTVSKDNLNIKSSAYLKIGTHCFFNSNCSITCLKQIEIGDNCEIANNVVIVDHDHDYMSGDPAHQFVTSPILIGNCVWIGANSVILRGTTIGDHAVIAAGSIVKGNVEANTLFYQKRENCKRSFQKRTLRC